MINLETQAVSRRAILGMVLRFAVVAPLPLFITVFLRLVNAAGFGFAPIIVSYFTNALINGERVFFWCSMYLLMSGFKILTDVLNDPTQLWFSNKAVLYFQERLLKQAAQVPLLHFLDADFHDVLSRAHRDFGSRVVSWFRSVLDNIHHIATLVGLFGAVLVIGGGLWCAAALFASAVLVLLTQKPIISLVQNYERTIVRASRTQETWAELLSDRSSAGEVRLFRLQHWLLAKWEKSYQKLANIELATLKKIMKWELIAGFSAALGYSAVIFIAAHTAQNADSKETAGIFTGLIYAAVFLQGFLSSIARSLGTLAEQSGILRELAILFTIQPTHVEKTMDSAPQPDTPPITIQMDALSFQYPQADTHTLKNITAKIAPGEIIALVGKNGSGKTTLANILLGLYPPSSGCLQFNGGTDKKHLAVSAVFQDFVRFLLPIRDNVGFGDIAHIHDDDRIRRALLKASSTFYQDLDVRLGPEFGGRELSGGEWVRIATARGFFRNSNFVVFDEPTASIDPIAEIDVIQQLLTKHEKRSIVVVSHRLGIARLCDRILVLDEGEIVEQGTHEDLIARGGIYTEMWRAQASWYV